VGQTEEPALTAVADAGPLIHLDELGALEVLRDCSKILVPTSVWQETQWHRPDALKNTSVPLLQQEAPAPAPIITSLTPLYTLHHGERDALSLCLSEGVKTFFTDDTAARLAASSLGITAHGSLGLLIRAVRRGLQTPQEVLSLLEAIPWQSSLHVRQSLLEEIIQQLRHEWNL